MAPSGITAGRGEFSGCRHNIGQCYAKCLREGYLIHIGHLWLNTRFCCLACVPFLHLKRLGKTKQRLLFCVFTTDVQTCQGCCRDCYTGDSTTKSNLGDWYLSCCSATREYIPCSPDSWRLYEDTPGPYSGSASCRGFHCWLVGNNTACPFASP